ncbi:MAG: hypothetical protein LBG92_01995 [Prevotellaceae bacterium]|nr:hypothetical protein [Prevotellaceae bacterium]
MITEAYITKLKINAVGDIIGTGNHNFYATVNDVQNRNYISLFIKI